MKYTLILTIFLWPLFLLPGAESWADPAASFRLSVRQDASGKGVAGSFLPSAFLLPQPLTNGARAFLRSGEELPLEWDSSGRALLFPATAEPREILIYGGYDRPVASQLPLGAVREKCEMLTMQEVENWRLYGNFQEYLERRRQEFQRRTRYQYDNLQKQLVRHKLSAFLSPPATGRIIPVGYWDLNANWQNDHPGAFQYNLYLSKVLQRNQDWRMFQRFAMKTFFPDPNFYKNRCWWELDSFFRQRERTENDWKTALASDRDKLIYGELTGRFASRLSSRSPAPRYPSLFKFFHHELDLRGGAVLRYTGQLRIDRPGTYEFEVATNSLWSMELDGTIAARKMLDSDRTKTHRFRFSKTLEPGLHPFVFYYARCDSNQDFEVRIKVPEKEWELLGDTMFAPAPPADLTGIVMRDGRAFPVIRRIRKGAFMTGKTSFCQLERLETPESLRWLYDGRELPLPPSQFFALSPETPGNVLLHYQGNAFQLPMIEKSPDPVILKGTVSMKLRVPPFVYDDEKPTATAVIRNESSLTLPMLLTIRTRMADGVFLERLEPVNVSPGITLKPIPAECEDSSLDVELSLPGYSFGREGGRILPAPELPEFPVLTHDRLTEPETGRPYCIILHRKTLSELRTWELPRLLSAGVPERILVLGKSDRLAGQLANRWPGRELSLESLAWPAASVNGESRLLRGLGTILKTIRSSSCDTFVLIPPESDIPLLGEEEFCRYLAVISDTVKQKKEIRRTYLIFPDGNGSPRNQRLLRFAREYGMELL